jgi:hypothetical protein
MTVTFQFCYGLTTALATGVEPLAPKPISSLLKKPPSPAKSTPTHITAPFKLHIVDASSLVLSIVVTPGSKQPTPLAASVAISNHRPA